MFRQLQPVVIPSDFDVQVEISIVHILTVVILSIYYIAFDHLLYIFCKSMNIIIA